MAPSDNINKLTDRQRACLALVAEGYTSKQIGRQLGISHSTVDNHILAAIQILQVADRREAGRLVAQHGQELPRQAKPLPEQQLSPMMNGSGPQSARQSGLRLLPPVGGYANEQTLGHKTIQIVSIAFLSTLAVIALALVISAALEAFR